MIGPKVWNWQKAALVGALITLAFLPGAPLSTSSKPASSVASALPIATRQQGKLSIRVRTEDGAAVARARVRFLVSARGAPNVVRDLRTDDNGALLVRDLSETATWLLVDGEGFGRASKSIVVEANERTLDITLTKETTLDIETKSEDGPLPEAIEFEIFGRDPLPIGARADTKGFAHIRGLPRGPFQITARAPGYEPATLHDFQSGDTGKHAILTLRKLGAVLAHVVDASGAPVQDAQVAVVGASLWPPRESKTDSSGTIRIASLAAGPYALRAFHGDDCTEFPSEVEVAKGGTVETTLRLTKGHFFRVIAVDHDRPVVGANVTFVDEGLSSFPLRAITQASGARLGPKVRFVGSVSVEATGFVSRLLRVSDEPEVRVELVRAGRIVGRVLDAEGRAIDGARLSVIGSDEAGMPIDDDPTRVVFRDNLFVRAQEGAPRLVPAGELGVVPGPVAPIPHGAFILPKTPLGERKGDPWISREHGTFTLDPVTPGSVRVIARHPEYVEGLSAIVRLNSGGEEEITLSLRRGGAIEGLLVDEHGRAVQGATIRIQDPRGALERTTRTADDGSFAFAAVPEEVLISVLERRELTESLRTSLSVREGKTERVTLRLPEPRDDVNVHIVDARGVAVAMAQVTMLSLDPSVPLRSTNFSNRSGDASMTRARGLAARIEVTAPGYAKRVVSSTGLHAEERVQLESEFVLEGEVRGSRGERIEGAIVSVQTSEGASRARTDKDGEFEIAHVGSGSVRLVASGKGYGRLERTLALRAPDRRGRVNVGRMELEPEVVVSGFVLDAAGKPIRGARIANNHVPILPASAELPDWIATTDADGAFTLSALPSGDLLVEALAQGQRRSVEHVRAHAGERITGLTFRMRNEAATKEPGIFGGGLALTLSDVNGAVRIVHVAEGSSAERSGLVAGDVLVSVGAKEVTSAAVGDELLSGAPGTEALVTVERAGNRETFRVERELLRR